MSVLSLKEINKYKEMNIYKEHTPDNRNQPDFMTKLLSLMTKTFVIFRL